MNKILRLALCGETSELSPSQVAAKQVEDIRANAMQNNEMQEETIIMSGPLAEVYTKALQIVFAKDKVLPLEPAVESQVMMAIALNAGAAQMQQDDLDESKYVKEGQASKHVGKTKERTVVFATDIHSVNANTVLHMKQRTKKDDRCIVVIDAVKNDSFGSSQAVYLSELTRDALKKQCDLFGIKLLYGMEQLVEELKK
jgi:hypothetical protein